MKKSKAAAAAAAASGAAKQPIHAAQNGQHALPSKLARYLDPDASWDKDQLLDAVHGRGEERGVEEVVGDRGGLA